MKDPYRFPRTYNDAFKGADYGCAIEHPPRRTSARVVWGLMIVALALALWL